MIAIAFFVLLGIIIGASVAYGVGHTDGQAEAERYWATHVDGIVTSALRAQLVELDQAGRLQPPRLPGRPFDFEAVERRRDAGESRWARG